MRNGEGCRAGAAFLSRLAGAPDEAAFPILLIGYAQRKGLLDQATVYEIWPMVQRAAAFVARTGPVTEQERCAEDGGYSPFTLAVAISARW